MIGRLTAPRIVSLNARVVGAESAWLADRLALDEAIEETYRQIGHADLYAGPFEKATVIAQMIATKAPFGNGNMKTAWLSATALLGLHGIRLVTVDFLDAQGWVFDLSRSTERMQITKGADWLIEHVGSVGDPPGPAI